ncbi:MAG: Nre family DNA repair protein [Archaeoglobaceae archaeon]
MDCIICRGRFSCGRSCVLNSFNWVYRSTEVFGSSPPSIFVGRSGYPNVFASPAVPPEVGNTSLYDLPEAWRNVSISEVFRFRSSLVLGRFRVDVRKADSKAAELVQELSLYNKPVDTELILEKPPRRPVVDEVSAPFGPSAPARYARIVSAPAAPKVVERVYYDRELPATEAIVELYSKGVEVSQIQKLLSAGALGVRRRLVPTRWAITAVDDTISKALIERIKCYEEIDSYRVFVLKKERNTFAAVLVPRCWSYEWGEAWFPNTVWNRSRKVGIVVDAEGYGGRKNYAIMGGCYYAARLAVAEYLNAIRRQATAIVWREIYPGFNTPIGVWFVRESLREMFEGKHFEFDDFSEVLSFLSSHLKMLDAWLAKSKLLKEIGCQSRLEV